MIVKITDKQRLDFIEELLINGGKLSHEAFYSHLSVSFNNITGLNHNKKVFIVRHKVGKFLEPLSEAENFEEAIDKCIREKESK